MKQNKQHIEMASIDCILENKQVPIDALDYQFKCDFCPNTFQTEENFNAHVLEHFVKQTCSNCNKMLIRIGSLWYELHVDESMLNESDDHKDDLVLESIVQINVEKLDDDLECNVNDYDINLDNNASDVMPHMSNEEPIEMAKSNKRKKGAIKTKLQLKKEEKKTANTTQSIGDGKPRRKGPLPRIKCRICDRIILKYNFESHLQKMHVPNVIVKKERIKCEICGKELASAGNLKIHQSIHTGIKRFVCNYCGTSFRQLYHLTEHLNGHTGSKPYQCKICDKQFTRYQILKAHQRVHTGEKPHICKIDGCDRAYSYEIDLKRHKFSAHGIYSKKHICSICEKVFSERKLLRKHLESHTAGNIRLPCKNNE